MVGAPWIVLIAPNFGTKTLEKTGPIRVERSSVPITRCNAESAIYVTGVRWRGVCAIWRGSQIHAIAARKNGRKINGLRHSNCRYVFSLNPLENFFQKNFNKINEIRHSNPPIVRLHRFSENGDPIQLVFPTALINHLMLLDHIILDQTLMLLDQTLIEPVLIGSLKDRISVGIRNINFNTP